MDAALLSQPAAFVNTRLTTTVRSTMLESRRNIALACALSALAGYVDAIGFLHLGGLFVSFMSGNSTRLGVSLAEGQWLSAAEAFGLGALVVTGAAPIGSPGCCWPRRCCSRPPRSATPFIWPLPRSPRSCWRWDWRMQCSRSG